MISADIEDESVRDGKSRVAFQQGQVEGIQTAPDSFFGATR